MSTLNYLYRAFGLTIASEFGLPELALGEGISDVTVRCGDVPERLTGEVKKWGRCEASTEHFLLKLEGVAHILASRGRDVTVKLLDKAREDVMRIFLIGSVFAALLHQRGLLVLHGAAVEADGACFILSGVSGAGKSTLAASFYQKGYRILSDDVCAISIAPGCKPQVISAYPCLRLWADTVQKLGWDTRELTSRQGKVQKYLIPLRESFCQEPLTLASLYQIVPENCQELSTVKLQGAQKMEALMNCTYRPRFLDGQGLKALHLQQCLRTVGEIDLYRICRPTERFCLTEVIANIESRLNK